MEQKMLHIRLIDLKKNIWIRSKIAKLKWKIAGHTLRQKDHRWNNIIVQIRDYGITKAQEKDHR